jgi:REP-associated tyrosine transposase
MSNHAHLFITPTRADPSRPSDEIARPTLRRGIQSRRHRRTGTLREGRFRSGLVDSERHALTLYQYIELNPVRAAMVDAPQRYPWSSARANLGSIRTPA